jgi:hypothetical protein
MVSVFYPKNYYPLKRNHSFYIIKNDYFMCLNVITIIFIVIIVFLTIIDEFIVHL